VGRTSCPSPAVATEAVAHSFDLLIEESDGLIVDIEEIREGSDPHAVDHFGEAVADPFDTGEVIGLVRIVIWRCGSCRLRFLNLVAGMPSAPV